MKRNAGISLHLDKAARHGFRLILIIGLIVSALNARPAVAQAQVDPSQVLLWPIQPVDVSPNFSQPALALDTLGYPHIAYAGNYLIYAWYDGAQWQKQTVETEPVSASRVALALDSQNRPQIVYCLDGSYNYRYARWDGTQWVIEPLNMGANPYAGALWIKVDAQDQPHVTIGADYGVKIGSTWLAQTGLMPSATALALDSHGNPHIVAGNNFNQLIYKHWDGSQWLVEAIPISGSSQVPNIILDSKDKVHIVYQDYALKTLIHVDNTTGSWQTEALNLNSSTASVAIDANDHLVITAVNSGHLYLLTRDPAGWSVPQEIESNSNLFHDDGQLHGLAIDAAGKMHLAYVMPDLWVANYDGSTWHKQKLESYSTAGTFMSMALDAQSNPHFAYAGISNGTYWLKYAAWDGHQFVLQNLDVISNSHAETSIKVDPTGKVYISYFANYQLKFAYWDGSAWTISTMAGEYGMFSSLALDSSNHPHIAYCSSSIPGVRYGSYDGSAWTFVTADDHGCSTGGDYGGNVSLAIDSLDNPHLAYPSLQGLKYAERLNGVWTVEIRAPGSAAALEPSLVLDAQGQPAISYAASSTTIYYQHRTSSGIWDTSTVISTVVTDPNWILDSPSLALDGEGSPHITYYRGVTTDTLNYISLKNGVWVNQLITGTGAFGVFNFAMLFAPDGFPRLGYLNSNSQNLYYAAGYYPILSYFYLPWVIK